MTRYVNTIIQFYSQSQQSDFPIMFSMIVCLYHISHTPIVIHENKLLFSILQNAEVIIELSFLKAESCYILFNQLINLGYYPFYFYLII